MLDDTARSQVAARELLPQIQPRTASLVQQLLDLVQQLVVFAQPQRTVQVPPRRLRGRPAQLPLPQLYLMLLAGVLRQSAHLTTIWRRLSLEAIGTWPPVQVTYEAVRKRLLAAGTAGLEDLFELVCRGLARWNQGQGQQSSALSLAPFASQVVALDETTLDQVRRLTDDLAQLPGDDPHRLPGKLAGLFDLRQQRWVRLQFRADVLAYCNVGILLLLEGLAPGSLILADLGYFSFPWFDYLTGQGYWWVSRLKPGVSYEMEQVLAYDDATGLLDAIVWLGKYRADRTASRARLVCFTVGGTTYRYLTNVLDARQLSLHDLAQLYARRWDIELAFKLLKCELGLRLWWGARPELVVIQLWLALILAQVLHALQLHIASQAHVDPFDVSLHVLLELLDIQPTGSPPPLELLVQRGRHLGLIRPSTRLQVVVPSVPSRLLVPLPDLSPRRRHARYGQRNPHPRAAPFVSRFSTQLLL